MVIECVIKVAPESCPITCMRERVILHLVREFGQYSLVVLEVLVKVPQGEVRPYRCDKVGNREPEWQRPGCAEVHGNPKEGADKNIRVAHLWHIPSVYYMVFVRQRASKSALYRDSSS